MIGLLVVLSTPASAGTALGNSLTEFRVPACGNVVSMQGLEGGITAGPDGNVWFTGNGIDRITPTGSTTCVSAGGSNGITAGPDGNLWFNDDDGANKIGRITPSGTLTEFTIPTSSSYVSSIPRPSNIVSGPDGMVWFTELGANQIGKVTTTGAFTEFAVPTTGAHPSGITVGPDGNLWFTEPGANQIGRVTPTGTITEFSVPTASSGLGAIAAGADGNLWFIESGANQIGRITPSGTFTEFPVPTPNCGLAAITAGPDGNVWFSERSANQVGRITPTGAIAESPVTAPVGITTGPDGNLWITEGSPKTDQAFPGYAVERIPPAPIPVSTSLPTISGSSLQRQALTEIHAVWTNSPSSYTYQWDRCSAFGTACNPIRGATSQGYALTAVDVGHRVRVEETALTIGGGYGDPAISAVSAVVQSTMPGTTSPPSIVGDAREGAILSEAHGGWTNGPIASYGYQWERCATAGINCSQTAGATAPTYHVTSADDGRTLRVQETATNATGTSGPAMSAATAVVRPAIGTITLGRITLRGNTAVLSCRGAAAATCSVASTLTITETIKGGKVIAISVGKRPGTKSRRKVLRLGSSSMNLLSGQTKIDYVALNVAGRQLLARYRVLRVTLTVAESTASGKSTVIATRVLVFKAKLGKRHG